MSDWATVFVFLAIGLLCLLAGVWAAVPIDRARPRKRAWRPPAIRTWDPEVETPNDMPQCCRESAMLRLERK